MSRGAKRKMCLFAAVCLCLVMLSACSHRKPTKKDLETAITVRYVGEGNEPFDSIVEVNVLGQDVSEDEIFQLDFNGKGYFDDGTIIVVPTEPFDPSRFVIVAKKIYYPTD